MCRKPYIKLIYTLLLSTLMCACSPRQAIPTRQAPLEPERGQVWQLVALQGRQLDRGKKAPTLQLDPETHLASGLAQCNTYTFRYKMLLAEQLADGDHYDVKLELWGNGDTKCPEGDMNAEERYLSLVAKATSMRLTSTTLTLYQKNREILHYELQ